MKTRPLMLAAALTCMAWGQQAFAAAPPNQFGPCQLATPQSIATWPFEISYVETPPVWNADKSAADLLVMQTQYFSGKSSPFMRNSIPPELGYYAPQLSFKIVPFVTYAQTIDGRSCAQVVGAKLVVTHAAQIYLARELAVRNCVSRSVLSHQLKHGKAISMTIKAALKDDADVKKAIFATYERQGAAGRDALGIAKQLSIMEAAATASLSATVQKNARVNRKQFVETRDNFEQLYSSCNGEFKIASKLAGAE